MPSRHRFSLAARWFGFGVCVCVCVCERECECVGAQAHGKKCASWATMSIKVFYATEMNVYDFTRMLYVVVLSFVLRLTELF